MDFALYFEELIEIAKYLFSQLEWEKFAKYWPYAILILMPLLLFIILINIIKRRRAVKEYIEDGVSLLITFPEMVDKIQYIKDLISLLHKEMYRSYASKYIFSLEVMVSRGNSSFFIYIPSLVYQQLKQNILDKYNYRVVTDYRDRFIDNISDLASVVEFELYDDFIIPILDTPSNGGKSLESELNEQEWFFLQFVCRPVDRKWIELLDRYINNLKQGKDLRAGSYGCMGGFFGIALPFLTLFADTFTSLVHKENDAGKGGNVKGVASLSKESEAKINLLEKKKDSHGFETTLRIGVNSVDKNRNFELLDLLLDVVVKKREEGNYYSVKKVHKKTSQLVRNDLLLCHLDKSVVDILSSIELSKQLVMIMR